MMARYSSAKATTRLRNQAAQEPGYGPDELPYEEALRREYAKQPKLPSGSPAPTGPTNRQKKLSQAVADLGGVRYTGASRTSQTGKPTTQEGNMPPRKAKPAPEPEEVEETEETDALDQDFTKYVDKEITPVNQALGEWLTEKTGYDVDLVTVQLVNSLRRTSRLDPANRERTEELQEERRAAKVKAKPAKAAAEDEGEEDEEVEEAPVKRRSTRGKAAVTSSSSTTKAGTGRPKPTTPRTARAKAGAAAPF